MSDLFHQDVPDDYIARVFAVMAMTRRHTYQILTKRHARMRSLLKRADFWREVRTSVTRDLDRAEEAVGLVREPLPNVWLGVSVENQQWADIRIPALLDTPSAVRFLSCEPLLGPVDLGGFVGSHVGHDLRSVDGMGPFCWTCTRTSSAGEAYHPILRAVSGIDWVIVGGESGRGARTMHPDWARSLRDQCQAAGVPFLFKQWGEYVTEGQMTEDTHTSWDIVHGNEVWNRGVQWRVGKRAAGRELDGRTWDEFPEVRR
jgi:protein gp37